MNLATDDDLILENELHVPINAVVHIPVNRRGCHSQFFCATIKAQTGTHCPVDLLICGLRRQRQDAMKFRVLNSVDSDTLGCLDTSMCMRKRTTMLGCKKDGPSRRKENNKYAR